MSDTETPPGWVRTTIAEVLAALPDGRLVHQGRSPQCHKEASPNQEIWGVLKTTAIQPSLFQPEENKRLPETMAGENSLEVQRGDLLLTCAGPRRRCGVACMVRDTRPKLMLSGKMYRFRVDDRFVNPQFIEAYLQSAEAQSEIDAMKTGGNESGLNLTQARFLRLPFTLPPLAEQHRIVEAIEAAFSKLDAGVAYLEAAKKRLERMRQATIDLACQGDLVKNNGASGDAVDLLNNIQQQRSTRARKRWHFARDIARDEIQLSIPAHWRIVSPDQICADDDYAIAIGPFGSSLKVSDYVSEGVPLVFVRNIRSRIFKGPDTRYISQQKALELSAHSVQSGDVLVTKMGAPPGDTCIYSGPRAVITADCLKVSCGSGILPDFVLYMMRSTSVQRQIAGITSGVAQQKISLGRFRQEFALPLAPTVEQGQIVEELSRIETIIGRLERSIDQQNRRAETLRRSVLAVAFSGRIVPQDPTDEPASKLLERIAANRAAAEPLIRTRRTRAVTAGDIN